MFSYTGPIHEYWVAGLYNEITPHPARLLRPGLFVLDVGCGTGAITAGIAKAVEPRGHVVGVDRDEALLEIARKEHARFTNLEFESGDAMSLSYRAQFDIVTAARTLQWVAEPGLAISKMKAAANFLARWTLSSILSVCGFSRMWL